MMCVVNIYYPGIIFTTLTDYVSLLVGKEGVAYPKKMTGSKRNGKARFTCCKRVYRSACFLERYQPTGPQATTW